MNTIIKRIKHVCIALIGLGLLAININARADTITRYVMTDTLGNPVAKTDSTGEVIWRQSYTPYGQQYQQADPDGPGFTGHRNDAATGLVYMQARYYDPIIGRFLSVDPVTFSPDSPGHFNLYWYANGNPYRYTDPDGRDSAAVLAPAAIGLCASGVCEAAALIVGPGVYLGVIASSSYQDYKITSSIPSDLAGESNNATDGPVPAVTNTETPLAASPPPEDEPPEGNDTKLDKLLDSGNKVENTNGSTNISETDGNANQAFDDLKLNDVKDVGDGRRVGKTDSGRRVVVRPSTKDGRTTIEVQTRHGTPKSKIRFNEGGK